LSDYLSTEELVKIINDKKALFQEDDYSKHKIKKNRASLSVNDLKNKLKRNKRIFLGIVILILLHLSYLVLPLVLPHNGLALFGMANVVAVPYDQEIVVDETGYEVYAAIVVIEKFKVEDLNIGDLVVIYGKFGSNVYWVERVEDFDLDARTITTSVDGFVASTDVTSFDDVEGFFVRMAGQSGVISYVSANLNGFILIILIYVVAIYGFYILFIEKHQKALHKRLEETENRQLEKEIDKPLI